jgi:putative FmdB family regulatory protein
MPIYEFHCDNCDRSFETLVRTGHYEDAQCPACNGYRLSREMSVFASSRVDQPGSSVAAGRKMMQGGGGCCGGGCGCH